jgi:hypothetical protein
VHQAVSRFDGSTPHSSVEQTSEFKPNKEGSRWQSSLDRTSIPSKGDTIIHRVNDFPISFSKKNYLPIMLSSKHSFSGGRITINVVN